MNILVLNGRNHDIIINEIEARRTAALIGLATPDSGLSLRAYLRRLRWLVENDVLTAQDAAARQKAVLPEGLAVTATSSQPETAPVSFRQRRFGAAIDVELLSDRLVYRSGQLFGTTNSHSVSYRHLKEPAACYETDHRYLLSSLIFAWCAIAMFAWMGGGVQGHAEGHYVGSAGLRRAIVDFGPALLAMAACAAIVSLVTRLRYDEPYPGIRLLRDRQHDALLDAIEQRRISAQRALANPDPVLTFEEQMQLLSELRDRDLINDEDHQRATRRATFVCNNPLLDQPINPPPQKKNLEAVI
jgi:hypothetical protein